MNFIKLTTEDGQVIVATPKVFKSGNSGYFTQVNIIIDGKPYGGQVQIWPKGGK